MLVLVFPEHGVKSVMTEDHVLEQIILSLSFKTRRNYSNIKSLLFFTQF